MKKPNVRAAILGASRGLGEALALQFTDVLPCDALFLSARKEALLADLRDEILVDKSWPGSVVLEPMDFADPASLASLVPSLQNFDPTHIIYVAGGGPHGAFWKKKWRDHHWAFQVGFLFPCQLGHHILSMKDRGDGFLQLKELIFIGSAIAESSADGLAASYAAAKHALRGWVTSVQTESPPAGMTLFSPGYMDTDMLPKSAWPRQSSGLVKTPKVVAEDLIRDLSQRF